MFTHLLRQCPSSGLVWSGLRAAPILWSWFWFRTPADTSEQQGSCWTDLLLLLLRMCFICSTCSALIWNGQKLV